MIGKSKAIDYGINDIRYVRGESANKKHPEKIFHILDQFLKPGLDAMAVWNAMRMHCLSHPRIENSVIRIEMSPSAEHTKDFTHDDWVQLWHDFAREYDAIELFNKKGKLVSGKTNIAGSKATVWLHLESKGNVPHLHAAVCRVDEDGKTNNDHNAHLRAQRAAERIAQQRGWTTAAEIHEANADKVYRDCMAILRQMPRWSFDDYFNRIRAKGYGLDFKRDSRGNIAWYSVLIGKSRYKASSLGGSRKLTVSRIADTWNRLHKKAGQQATKPHESKPQTSAKPLESKPQPSDNNRPEPIKNPYLEWESGKRSVEIPYGCKIFTRFIPEPIMQVFDDEIDYREISNCVDITNEALYQFAVAAFNVLLPNVPLTPSGGGGASNNALPKKRDDVEAEIRRARSCAHAAMKKIKPIIRTGYRL